MRCVLTATRGTVRAALALVVAVLALLTWPMSTGMFVLGLVTSMVVSWVVAYTTAELYKLWAR